MKKMLLAFLCGMVVPLGLMALGSRAAPEPEETVPATQSPSQDAGTVITVLTDAEERKMALSDYLTGVVLSEMPADFEEEALKAQAVVARTYTCKRVQGSKHETAAVCTEPSCCQGYLDAESYVNQGGDEANVDKVRRAVEQTDGLVLTYDGALIDATYFSCSGGSTEDAVAVWGQDVPYLQAVDSPGEEDAPRYSNEVTYSGAELCKLLGLDSTGLPENWFGPATYTDGGGVETMEICGVEFSGVELRKKLGLRSTVITVHVQGDSVTFQTRGFGHRVGMSQYGANAMAENGSGYEEILAHYYQGTELGKMDEFE